MPAILSILLLSIGLNVYAQATGRVSGRVLDQTGAALAGVAIDLAVKIMTGMTIPFPDAPVSMPAAIPITMRIFGELNLSN